MSNSLLLDWVDALGPAAIAGIAAYTAVKVEMAILKTRMSNVELTMKDIHLILREMADYKTRFEMQGGRIDELTRQIHDLQRRFIDFIVERNSGGQHSGTTQGPTRGR